MENLRKELNIAINLINNPEPKDIRGDFRRIYPFTNENIKGCLEYFDLKDKTCLTVLGSSDQVLDMYLKGASSITAFDVNPLTKHYFYLKKAALLSNVSLTEYMKFFYYKGYMDLSNGEAFNNETFEKIVNNLPKESYIFWTELFKQYNPNVIRQGGSLFLNDEAGRGVLKRLANYLNKENFDTLKEQTENINIDFINSDIKDLSSKLTKSYDFMYLSNIMTYVSKIFLVKGKIGQLMEYKKIIEELSKHLNVDGKIIVSYIYQLDNIYHYDDAEARDEVFSERNYEYKKFKALRTICEEVEYPWPAINRRHDGCLVYKKKIG